MTGASAMVPPSAEHVYPSRASAWYATVMLLLVMAFAYLDRIALSFLITPIQKDLHLSDVEAGLILGPAFMVLFVAAALPMGAIADRHSRRNLLIAGLLIWSLATALSALAHDFTTLALARAGVGLGEACLVPTIFSLVGDYFPPHLRGKPTAVITIGTAIGAGGGLFGGGYVLATAERIGAIQLPVLGPIAPWGLVLGLFGIAGLLFAVLLLSLREPRRVAPRPSAVTQIVSQREFAGFLCRNRNAIALIMLPYVMLGYAQYAIAGWIPTLLARSHGLTPSEAAINYGLVTTLASPLAAILGGILADRFAVSRADGRFVLVRYFLPMFMPGVLLVCFGSTIEWVLTGVAIEIFATGVVLTSVYASISDIAVPQMRGRLLAFYGLLANIFGIGLGPTVTALITDEILQDPSMLHLALAIAIAPAWVVGCVGAFAGRSAFARLWRQSTGINDPQAHESAPALPLSDVTGPGRAAS